MADPIVNDDDSDDDQTPQPEPVHKPGGPLTGEDAEALTSKDVG
jgi:hypothetical protein